VLAQFDSLVADHRYPWKLGDILPAVLPAGREAGRLTEEGARLLDPSGKLRAGVPVAPAEGDAGTGMVATNSVARRTANVSAGTSIFAMVVLEGPLKQLHEEIDLVTTPAGDLVGMAHCNNGAVDLQAWVGLFGEAAAALGAQVDTTALFQTLYTAALEGDADGGGMLAYNYLAGEHVVGLEAGRPLFVRTPHSSFTLANFMRTHLFAALGALRVGMDILLKDEGVELDSMFAHGGLFKTKGVAQRFLAAAMNTPVSVGEVAGEGGAWGMALLASFLRADGESLADWLASSVFGGAAIETAEPDGGRRRRAFDRFSGAVPGRARHRARRRRHAALITWLTRRGPTVRGRAPRGARGCQARAPSWPGGGSWRRYMEDSDRSGSRRWRIASAMSVSWEICSGVSASIT